MSAPATELGEKSYKPARIMRKPQLNLVRKSMLAFQRIVIGNKARVQSVAVLMAACSYDKPRITLLWTHFPSIRCVT